VASRPCSTYFADYLGWPRNWNGLLIYLLNSDGVPDWSDGGTNPRVLGRKIEKGDCPRQRGAACPPDCGLDPSAITLAFRHLSGISNPGFHGISQVVYEYASAGANNGSGFEG